MTKKRLGTKHITHMSNPEEQAEWWREHTKDIPTEYAPDLERECPYCKDINPCTSVETCISCGHSLENARRVPPSESQRHSRY